MVPFGLADHRSAQGPCEQTRRDGENCRERGLPRTSGRGTERRYSMVMRYAFSNLSGRFAYLTKDQAGLGDTTDKSLTNAQRCVAIQVRRRRSSLPQIQSS
jgi:hypothetical protein